MSTMTRFEAPPKKKVSPRRRAQRIRWAQYAVLVVVALTIALVADWGQIQQQFFRTDLISTTLTEGIGGALRNTIIYTAGAFVIGLLLGTMLALMRLSSVAPYRWIATVWIEFFRGLPAIIVFIAFGLMSLAFEGFVIPYDPYGGVMTRKAWGRTIFRVATPAGIPSERAASICPGGTAWIPARIVSAM